MFSLRFKAKTGFSGSPLTAVVTTSATDYTGAGASTQIVLDSAIPTITGILGDNDAITKNPNPVIIGNAQPGALVELFNGITSLG